MSQSPADKLLHRTSPVFLIGLAGPDGVGKGTFADKLGTWFFNPYVCKPYRVEEVRVDYFARPLYAMVAALCGVTEAHIRKHKNDVFTEETAPARCLIGKSYRWLLRVVGTEFGRNVVSPDLWVDLAKARSHEPNPAGIIPNRVVIFDDLRFENEAPIFDVIIELSRDGISYSSEHVSASGLPPHIPRLRHNLSAGGHLGTMDFIRSLFPTVSM